MIKPCVLGGGLKLELKTVGKEPTLFPLHKVVLWQPVVGQYRELLGRGGGGGEGERMAEVSWETQT